MTSAARQRGIAILTAVGLAALVAALAAWIAWRQGLWFRQLENQMDQAEAMGVVRASINLARLTLKDDARLNQVDHMLEPWNIPIPAIPVENGRTGGRVLEQNGFFNLNNLVSDAGQANEVEITAARKLFTSLSLSPDLVNALADWEDADSDARSPGGAEDNQYLQATPPYRAANQRLTDLGSLNRVAGFTPDVINTLRPFVTVLPIQTAVNVNFASAEVLAAVVPGLSVTQAQSVVAKRAGSYFATTTDFINALPDAAKPTVVAADLAVQSTYFINEIDAHFGRVSLRYAALLERRTTDIPRIVWLRRE
ncbi:general secretion pathway protein K [Silvimonas terrae]|uniref:Type II secretion system protein K n=1 Tax=Silvimonas terrae TaxID=300266 RepID=A0A840RD81_9NEIS|nr:type II secretion system minor pseudopilin GspK [Silvimonas terrae]MBB5190386.1 general secretion pathway protein K [Silvimonas terrae]